MIKVRKWICYTKFEPNEISWIFDAGKWDVSNEELSLCVEEQLYKYPLEEK